MPDNSTIPTTRHFTLRYLLALSLIAALSLSAYILIRVRLHQQASDAPVINLSGRQRMLSQKLTKEVLLLAQNQAPETRQQHRQQLAATVSNWSRVHKGLQQGDEELKLPGDNSEEIRALFAKINPYYQELKQATDKILTMGPAEFAQLSPDALLVRDIVDVSLLYLQWMDLAVFQYDKEAQARLDRLKQIETVILFLLLSVLVLEGLFIFRPLVLRLRKTYRATEDELREANERLEEKNRLLMAFHQITQVTLSSLHLEQVLDNLAQQIVAAGIFRSIMIALVDEQRQCVEVVRNTIWHTENGVTSMVETSAKMDLRYDLSDDNITAEVARTGQMQVVEGDDDRFDRRIDAPGERQGKIAYFIPVKQEDRVLAVLATGSEIEDREKMLRQIEVMQPLLDQVAIALEHARLYQTLQESQEHIRQSQKMQAVGQLTAGIAHNFNNMLMGILTSLEEAGLEGSDHSTLLQEAEATTLRAAEMIDQLMLFARPEETIESKPVEIPQLIRETIAICQQTFDRKVVIRNEVPEALPVISGDANQLQQVFLNLLLNARDALAESSQTSPSIQIEATTVSSREEDLTAHLSSASGDYLRINITDNGIGMDVETQQRIFEPFFTTKDVDKGTGLGLSTAYAIVREHRGWIECDSQPGGGTTFSLYLPVSEEELAAIQKTEGVEQIPRGTETILVIEDEKTVRLRLVSMLERYGYMVLTGEDGTEGLDLFRRERDRIALVLLDLSLPGLSGQEVLAQLRELDPEIRVIISTGYAHRMDSLEVQALLKKPYRLTQALRTIRQVLDE